jgi:hypothetical protein
MDVASWNHLGLVADAVHGDEPAILGEKPQHAGIELPYVTQFNRPLQMALDNGSR